MSGRRWGIASVLFLAGVLSSNQPALAETPFKDLDTDGDLRISWQEYLTAWEEDDFLTTEIPRTWRTFDLDGDEHLSPAEFAHVPKFQTAEARFEAADIDGDGRLTKEEFLAPYSPYGRLRARQQFHLKNRGEPTLSLTDFSYEDEDGRQSADDYLRNAIGTQWEQHARNETVWHDGNADGFLSTMEFARSPHGTRDLAELVGELDTDFNGALTLEEVMAVHAPPAEPAGPTAQYAYESLRLKLENGFLALDRDRNGSLTEDEQQAQRGELVNLLLGKEISLPPSRSVVAGHEKSEPKQSVVPLAVGLLSVAGLAIIGLLTIWRRPARNADDSSNERSVPDGSSQA